jgi:hypothetical protein
LVDILLVVARQLLLSDAVGAVLLSRPKRTA